MSIEQSHCLAKAMFELAAGRDLGLEGVEIRHYPALGDGYLFSWIFESVGGASFIYPWDQLRPQWTPQRDASFGYTLDCPGNSEHPLRLAVRLGPVSDSQLDIEASMLNPSDRHYTHCWADLCLMFKYAPHYPDERGERCILHTADGLVAAYACARVIRKDAWSPRVQAYRVANVDPPYPYGVVQGLALWSISPTHVESGCIMMARDDGSWHVGVGWDCTATVAHNPDDEHHCIHSDPWFGTVPPHEKVTRHGVIMCVRGSADDLLTKYLGWQSQL